MSANIQIVTDQGPVVRGQKTPIRVAIRFDKPYKVRGIRAMLYGGERVEADYTETSTDSKGKTTTTRRTAVELHEIIRKEFLLHGEERLGFFSRIGDSLATWAGGGKHELLGPGEQEFSIQVEIPVGAPASFKGKKCEVFYKVDVSVDLPIRIDWSESLTLNVPTEKPDLHQVAPVHVVFPDESGRSIWDKAFGKAVTLNLAVDRGTMSEGESAQAMLTVESPEPLQVKKMDIHLVGVEATKAQGHTDSHSYRYPLGEIGAPGVISNESAHEFDIVIPEINGPISQVGMNYEVNWQIEVRLHIPWAKDPIIRVPIRIV